MSNQLVWQIAIRYLRGKRTANAVPILSRISMGAIAVGSCAMIILLSVFNGFEFIVKDLYKAFYPDIKISAAQGKFFIPSEGIYTAIKNVKGVVQYTNVVEDNVLLKSDEDQRIATIKGIDGNYFAVNDVKRYITDGSDSITVYDEPLVMQDSMAMLTKASTIMGSQLMSQLALDPANPFSTVMVIYPNAEANVAMNPAGAYQSLKLRADGAFRIQDDFDSKYLLTSLPLVQDLLNAKGKLSSVELKLENSGDAEYVKEELSGKLGKDYKIETRYEQNRTLYMVMNSEKWAMFAILVLVLLIASLNMIGALSLLVMEKQKDMAILKAMGAESHTIRNIFVAEGVLWSLVGGGIGLILGTLICIGQQQFHFIQLPGAFIIDAFPVHVKITDYPVIIATVMLVGVLASWYPAQRSTRIDAPSLRSN
jgi:lipoprotein-releasing system permease protein